MKQIIKILKETDTSYALERISILDSMKYEDVDFSNEEREFTEEIQRCKNEQEKKRDV